MDFIIIKLIILTLQATISQGCDYTEKWERKCETKSSKLFVIREWNVYFVASIIKRRSCELLNNWYKYYYSFSLLLFSIFKEINQPCAVNFQLWTSTKVIKFNFDYIYEYIANDHVITGKMVTFPLAIIATISQTIPFILVCRWITQIQFIKKFFHIDFVCMGFMCVLSWQITI